jgi:hypothetical protein
MRNTTAAIKEAFRSVEKPTDETAPIVAQTVNDYAEIFSLTPGKHCHGKSLSVILTPYRYWGRRRYTTTCQLTFSMRWNSQTAWCSNSLCIILRRAGSTSRRRMVISRNVSGYSLRSKEQQLGPSLLMCETISYFLFRTKENLSVRSIYGLRRRNATLKPTSQKWPFACRSPSVASMRGQTFQQA